MLFQRKIERAQQWLRERNQTTQPAPEHTSQGDLPSMEELRRQGREEIHLDKKDLPAMILAALITIMPVALLVLGLFCLYTLLFVG